MTIESHANQPPEKPVEPQGLLVRYGRNYHFVRSGNIYLRNGALMRTGDSSFNWSNSKSTYSSSSIAQAYYFAIWSTDAIGTSQGPGNLYVGYPVRCLVYYVALSK